jgi:ATP-binding cassette subfamily F protein 3
LLVADGKLKPFDGDLDEYQKWLLSRSKAPRDSRADGDPVASAGAPSKAPIRAAPGKARAARDPIEKLRRQLEQVEQRLEQLTRERQLLEAQEMEAGNDDSLTRRRANLARDTATLEAQWIEIGTALEAAENSQEPV